jgi:hypothetical protein
MYFPIITPIILALTTKPNVYDVINESFHRTVGALMEEKAAQAGVNEDRRGVLYIDPGMDRESYFKNKEKR